MRSIFFLTIALFLAVAPAPQKANAQQLNTLFGNTAMGAATGATLGAATMALQNTDDFTALRFGLGAGIIGGLAIGIYDVYNLSEGGQVFGTFQSMPTTTSIIFLDTMYGAGVGGLVGIAVALMDNSKLVDGLQYGAGIGAWVGFGFGLVDAFYLARRSSDGMYFDYEDFSSNTSPTQSSVANGFVTIIDDNKISARALNPSIHTLSAVSPQGNTVSLEQHLKMEFLNLVVRF